MKLVFVHGRAQAGKDSDLLRREWLAGMSAGMAAAGFETPDPLDVRFPFYGDRLDELVSRLKTGAVDVLHRGVAAESVAFDPLAAAVVRQMARRAGIDEQDAMADLTVVERGPERWEWVQALLRRVERKAPWVADLAVGKFTTDVRAYLSNAFIQGQINAIVLPALEGEPAVVVSHSLGTVVAYTLLATHPELEVPLFVTAGSPLGLAYIQRHLPIPLHMPCGQWLNLTDEEDLVALHSALTVETFVDGIENYTDVDNGDDPHSIARYLSDARVGQRLAMALS